MSYHWFTNLLVSYCFAESVLKENWVESKKERKKEVPPNRKYIESRDFDNSHHPKCEITVQFKRVANSERFVGRAGK